MFDDLAFQGCNWNQERWKSKHHHPPVRIFFTHTSKQSFFLVYLLLSRRIWTIISWVRVYAKVLNEKDTVPNFIQSEFKGLNHAVPPQDVHRRNLLLLILWNRTLSGALSKFPPIFSLPFKWITCLMLGATIESGRTRKLPSNLAMAIIRSESKLQFTWNVNL